MSVYDIDANIILLFIMLVFYCIIALFFSCFAKHKDAIIGNIALTLIAILSLMPLINISNAIIKANIAIVLYAGTIACTLLLSWHTNKEIHRKRTFATFVILCTLAIFLLEEGIHTLISLLRYYI